MEAQSGGGGASRTFHSIFARRLDPAEGTASDSSAPKTADENDDDVWDDDFPGDATMDEGNNAATKLIQTISAESRRSIEDWADDDDEEDNWRDALQARVDQLELVVEKRSEAAASANGSAVDGLPHGAGVASYGVPVDQRATLTLLSKTTLQRSVSAPVDPEQKPVSRLRAPIATRSTTLTANATNTSKAKSSVDRWNDRKNTRSKEPVPRPTLATEQKRISKGLPKTPPASATPTPGNSVFVRAVVARGPTSTTTATRLRESRISLTKDGHDEKRAKTEERADILALSDAELVRRHILSDVKKMSVERIVADAKRLHYLEDFYRRHPGSSDLMTATNTGPNPTSDRHSSPS